MDFNYPSILHPTCWPLSFTIRVVICISCCLISAIWIILPRESKLKKRAFIPCIIYVSLFFITIGLDYFGYPIENVFGFQNLESACFYASKGTIASTMEGKDSILVICEKELILEDKTYLVCDIAVYKKGIHGWKTVNPAIKKKQIATEIRTSDYWAYILKYEDSSDEYLVIYDPRAKVETITCADSSEFDCIKESTGIVYWIARCDELSENQELNIEIQRKGIDETDALYVSRGD